MGVHNKSQNGSVVGIVVYSVAIMVGFYFVVDAYNYGKQGPGVVAYYISIPAIVFFIVRMYALIKEWKRG
jgi:hypothetical protein